MVECLHETIFFFKKVFLMLKEKLSIQEQINHIESKGITFNLITRQEAQDFLENYNSYFRLKSYAKNFSKYNHTEKKGKYINLDFLFLKQLSIIDFYLRRILFKMAIDIEYRLKINLLKTFNQNQNGDGYKIIQDFFQQHRNIYNNFSDKYFQAYKNFSYNSQIIEKYHPRYPIWAFLEILTFGDFIRFYRYYYEKNNLKIPFHEHLESTRILRNATAHNNCLLNNLTQERIIQTSSKIIKILKNDTATQQLYPQCRRNYLIMDIISVYYLFMNVSNNQDIKDEITNEIKTKVIQRFFKNNYFLKNKKMTDCMNLLDKAIDIIS